jgi:hypothetical protein
MQTIITAVIVLAAAAYAAWRLLPDAPQRRLLTWVLVAARDRRGLHFLAGRAERALQQRAQPTGGCSGCNSRPQHRPR